MVFNDPLSYISDSAFDDSVDSLHKLQIINSNLSSIPHALSHLHKLTYLDISFSPIQDISGLANISGLTYLGLKNNEINEDSDLEISMSRLKGTLEELNLNNNDLTTLPDLSDFFKLETIYLAYNNISTESQSDLLPNSLTKLVLGENSLDSIPNSVKNLTKIQTVYIGGNRITTIENWELPSSLLELDLSYNLIQVVTNVSFVNQVSRLTTLDLSGNPLSVLASDAFSQLQQMTYLDLSSTSLQRLPLAVSPCKR